MIRIMRSNVWYCAAKFMRQSVFLLLLIMIVTIGWILSVMDYRSSSSVLVVHHDHRIVATTGTTSIKPHKSSSNSHHDHTTSPSTTSFVKPQKSSSNAYHGQTSSIKQQKHARTNDNHRYITQSTKSKNSTSGSDGGGRVIRVTNDFIKHLRSLPPIPKVIHVLWPDKNVLSTTKHEVIEHGVKRLERISSGWNVMVYNDSEIVEYVAKSPLLDNENKRLLRDAHIVEVTDVFRLLIMFEKGGLYTDIDKVYNVPLDDVVKPSTRMLLPTYYDINFMQDLMCSSPGNRVFKATLERQSKLRTQGGSKHRPMERMGGWLRNTDVMDLGPKMWSKVVTQEVFGRQVQGKENIVAARRGIDLVAPLIVTKKDTWCNGILVRPYKRCKSVTRTSLYRQYKIGSWDDVAKKRWKQSSKIF